jgi:hypothetical protein
MYLLSICLTTSYFQFEDKFYWQKGDMTMGNSISPVVSKIFMEYFEEIALGRAYQKWLRYFDDIFAVSPQGPAVLQEFLDRINSLKN